MSSISAVSGASSAWSDMSSARAQRKDKMFAKADADGNGSVDKSELQGVLDHVAEKRGTTAVKADDAFGKMDADGDGSLSKDEMENGMKDLMPKPSSTMEFAQKSGGAGRPEGPPPDGPPPAGGAGKCEGGKSAESSSTSTSTDPLDTNKDGTVSAQEKAAGDLADMISNLMSTGDTDGDKKISQSEADTLTSKLMKQLQQYAQTASYSTSTSDSAELSLVA